MRERKRKHDDIHWPNWSSRASATTKFKRSLKNMPADTRQVWILTEPNGKKYRLGRYDNEKEARSCALQYGHHEPFELTLEIRSF